MDDSDFVMCPLVDKKKGWYRVIDDSGDDYLYPPEQFEIVEE